MKPKRTKKIVVPVVPAAEGIQGLLPEEVAFVQEELALRAERQWSQEEVERRSGVKRQTISNAEHRRCALTLATAIKISHAYGKNLARFADASRRWLHSLLLLAVEMLPG